MAYIEGFLLAIPKNRLDEYKKAVAIAAKAYKALGAIDYVEAVGDNLSYGEHTSFPRAVMAKDDEVVIFSWLVWPSKETRDAGQAKVMEDEAMTAAMVPVGADMKRMVFGGFTPIHGR
jgi:uncharacterized protein YbaA (DUF1428 family)